MAFNVADLSADLMATCPYRGGDYFRLTPVFALDADWEEWRRARAAGADRFIMKGEYCEVLVDAIHRAGNRSNGLTHRKAKQP